MNKEYATIVIQKDGSPISSILISAPSIEDDKGHHIQNPKFIQAVETTFFDTCAKFDKKFINLSEETKLSYVEDGCYQSNNYSIFIGEPDKVINIT